MDNVSMDDLVNSIVFFFYGLLNYTFDPLNFRNLRFWSICFKIVLLAHIFITFCKMSILTKSTLMWQVTLSDL
jgi:hypothetical protein